MHSLVSSNDDVSKAPAGQGRRRDSAESAIASIGKERFLQLHQYFEQEAEFGSVQAG
jgi:hypothetical protein